MASYTFVTRMSQDVLVNTIVQVACKRWDKIPPIEGWRQPRGSPPITWVHQVYSDVRLSGREALATAPMEPMTGIEKENQSRIQEFILLGFPGSQYLQISLFVVFSMIYILTVAGNVAIIVLVKAHHHLHTPMYFLLCNLSFLEIWYTTACVPKTIAIFLGKSRTIPFGSCILQMYFIFSLGCTEYFLLSAMAYDRYLAICYPLHYRTIMNSTKSAQLALGSWMSGFLAISIPASLIARLFFCSSNVINHFFCSIDSLIILSCTNTSVIELTAFLISIIVILGSCSITLVSYIYIISTVLRIPSAQGRQKAFSTCSAHLIVVTIWYSATIFLYVRPSKQSSLETNKIVNTLNTIVTPLLNPFIYTLRNKEVKDALWKVFGWT
ncbi:olfactory receptor 6F1-like [Malaclemys terrapin pileata]|uniref:olfactory receptor 6F1-like n=1 Tax=Malaclemys terrapin pileata TaxID=2991368 RepID=UPI0023A87A0F|nr:olfactory receptor 6F1-like [Malaclemys terrapin pileata]